MSTSLLNTSNFFTFKRFKQSAIPSYRTRLRRVLTFEVLEGKTLLATNLVKNGGFETGDFTGWTNSGNLDGYTYVASASDGIEPPHSGNYAAMLGAIGADGNDNKLTQTLATVPGQQYVFKFFYLRGDLNGAGTPSNLHVFWNSTDIYDEVNSAIHGYVEHDFNVTATGTSTVIEFDSRNDPWFDALDDVSVTSAIQIKLDNLPLDGQYHISASPSMPDIQAELTGIAPSVASSLQVTWVEQVSFDPDDDPTGNADPGSANTIVDTQQTIGTHVTFTQNDIPGVIQGSMVTITATAIVNNQQINVSMSNLPDTDTPIMIVGDNPTPAAVASFVQSLGTPTLAARSSYNFSHLVDAIIMRESGGDTLLNRQFSSNGIPFFNQGGDSGVGLMQITNTDNSPNRSNADIWNWQTNILDGFGILQGINTTANPGISGLVQAKNHFTSEIKAAKPKLTAIAARYHYNSVTIASPNVDQLVLTAVGLYNNGSLYNSEYSRTLVPTVDPNDPTHGIVQLTDGRNPYVALVLSDYAKL